jgi:hypothetical protein
MAPGLGERQALAAGITETDAAGNIYALVSPEVHDILTVERPWPADRYERLANSLCHVPLPPATTAADHRRRTDLTAESRWLRPTIVIAIPPC